MKNGLHKETNMSVKHPINIVCRSSDCYNDFLFRVKTKSYLPSIPSFLLTSSECDVKSQLALIKSTIIASPAQDTSIVCPKQLKELTEYLEKLKSQAIFNSNNSKEIRECISKNNGEILMADLLKQSLHLLSKTQQGTESYREAQAFSKKALELVSEFIKENSVSCRAICNDDILISLLLNHHNSPEYERIVEDLLLHRNSTFLLKNLGNYIR
jgi:hypothetical protein